jgi:hypothetical protein
MCVSDNGTELTGMAILRWSQETNVEWPQRPVPLLRGRATFGVIGWRQIAERAVRAHRVVILLPNCEDSPHRRMNLGAQTMELFGGDR